MRKVNASLVAFVTSTALFAATLQYARADVIGTEQYLQSLDREAALTRIEGVLARDAVRGELERLGVDTELAGERVAALTDEELQLLAQELENLPAGGSALGTLGVVFIVLLVLELVGVIDIFSKI
jgi:hypothetical protein